MSQKLINNIVKCSIAIQSWFADFQNIIFKGRSHEIVHLLISVNRTFICSNLKNGWNIYSYNFDFAQLLNFFKILYFG